MTTLNGLPAHILLVHAIVVLLPLAGILLVLCAFWPSARHKLAGPNALLSLFTLILVPLTTEAGEWLERRVTATSLVRAHTQLGDTALLVAVPVAALAAIVWWRHREDAQTRQAKDRRTFLAPASRTVTIVVATLSVLVAGGAIYDIYRIGDSGARASWQDRVASTPEPAGSRR